MSGSSTASRSPESRLQSLRETLALTLCDGVGAAAYHDLVARFGSAAHALGAAPYAAKRDELMARADTAIRQAARTGARIAMQGDDAYPSPLLDLPDPPPALWLLGDDAMLARPVVAVVGTRNATAYGERVARELASALARAGACVLSGMARGIDGEAHRAALAADGATVAVLGTGVDVPYPAAHRPLHRLIAARGLLVSELPCGDRAHKGSFPRRNRLIAALATATIVVEAGARSGALITARNALDLGRDVAAVPGQIDLPQAAGSNLLLRDGAIVIAEMADALVMVGLSAPRSRPVVFRSEAEERIWDALARGALDMDSLCAHAGLPARECIAAIGALELRGIISCALTGEISRR